MEFLWNHWFWITLGLLAPGLVAPGLGGESLPSRDSDLQIGLEAGEEGLVSLPEGARGGRILIIPDQDSDREEGRVQPEPRSRRPSVSVSKSVSKVSVKMGDISVEPGIRTLSRISDIYVDRGIGNGVESRGSRRIDPPLSGYNLVYQGPAVEKTTAKPPVAGLIETIIAKLKSLAETTSSRIRLSSLLLGGGENTPAESAPAADTPEPAAPGKISNWEDSSINSREGKSGTGGDVFLTIDDMRVSASPAQGEGEEPNPVQGEEEELNPAQGKEEEPNPDARADIKTISEEIQRSPEARGRSLPLNVLDKKEVVSRPATGRIPVGDAAVRIQEVRSEEWTQRWDKVYERWSQERGVGDRQDSPGQTKTQQADFDQDFTDDKLNNSGDDGIIIEAEKGDFASISAIVGVVVGIVIFIIISIVLVLLGLQRERMKKTEPAEDGISQSSYMTYSTTVSDTSVNYGPNWDKDMIEDLCSLDNDSFLNSLEAVTATDFWGERKY